MGNDVTVVVATFGEDDRWAELAQERAVPSAEGQAPCIHVHADTLAEARNRGLARTSTEFVVFLDADDHLTPGYIDTLLVGTADLRVPSVSYVRHGRPGHPHVPKVPGHDHACGAACMEDGNFAVIGSMARVAAARDAGGFREEPLYEDWSLWLRMVRDGATVETIPEAVYVAEWRPDSRNRSQPIDFKNAWHHRIATAA